MKTKLVAGPAAEWITLSDAKVFLRVDNTSDDTLITSLISAVRQFAEGATRRVFITQTWDLWLDRFPSDQRSSQWWDGVREGALSEIFKTKRFIDLPYPPLQSVTYLNTYDESDV